MNNKMQENTGSIHQTRLWDDKETKLKGDNKEKAFLTQNSKYEVRLKDAKDA